MKTKIKGQYRQGDVLIERTSETIPTTKPDQTGRIILAHGEVTGHSHDVIEGEAWKTDGGVDIVRVKKATEVRHQEHGRIPLKRGTHKIVRQKEYAPEAIRNVAD